MIRRSAVTWWFGLAIAACWVVREAGERVSGGGEDWSAWSRSVVRSGKPIVILETYNPLVHCVVVNNTESPATRMTLRVERSSGAWDELVLARRRPVSLGPCPKSGWIRTVHVLESGCRESLVLWRVHLPRQ